MTDRGREREARTMQNVRQDFRVAVYGAKRDSIFKLKKTKLNLAGLEKLPYIVEHE